MIPNCRDDSLVGKYLYANSVRAGRVAEIQLLSCRYDDNIEIPNVTKKKEKTKKIIINAFVWQ